MTETARIHKPAPLKNVAAFSTMLQRVVERRRDLPGLACFFGPSGLGKTKSAIYGANKYHAAYVECGQFTTAKSLLVAILKELGQSRPRGTVTDLIDEAIMLMIGQPDRPLIVDEAHHVAHKRFVDLLRELHDKSLAPVILIGEETLPKQLEGFERVHNRMLEWVRALPCDEEDFRLLAKSALPAISLAPDLIAAILQATGGNTRRIVVNLAKAEEQAKLTGSSSLDLAGFGGMAGMVSSSAPRRLG